MSYDNPRTPAEALHAAVIAGFVSSRGHHPGVVIEALPARWRELLKALTSDDSLSLRVQFDIVDFDR